MDQAPLSFFLRVQVFHQHFGAQGAGAQRVDADIIAAMYDGQLTGQCEHAALAGGIGQLRGGSAEQGDKGGGVDDRTATGAEQGRNAVFAS